jgi:hypothetical protein
MKDLLGVHRPDSHRPTDSGLLGVININTDVADRISTGSHTADELFDGIIMKATCENITEKPEHDSSL